MGSFPSWNRWAEWNGKYRDDIRSFLKGDAGFARAAALRITGSPDLYSPQKRGADVSVNFITCHDGFTLYDLYAYNQKHNEANGWNNTDGADDNRSWNCGFEGDTEDPAVLTLRVQMMKNACAVLMCSRGTPMFFAGDEFGNTQFGNNNAYCQDNEISWLDWTLLEKNREIFDFFRYMIRLRMEHPILRENTAPCGMGFPFTSFHGARPWKQDFEWDTRLLGVLFAGKMPPDAGRAEADETEAGRTEANGPEADEEVYGKESPGREEEDILYLTINTYWEAQEAELPRLT